MMSLCRSSVSLPSPNGALADSLSSATIKKANQAIVEDTFKSQKARGIYRHVDAEMQVKIAQYACEHNNKAVWSTLRVSWVLMSS